MYKRQDIKYVTLHKNYAFASSIFVHNFVEAEKIHDDSIISWQGIEQEKQILSEILSGDALVYEDDTVVVYKIPKPNSSEPFLVLGSGWHVFDNNAMLRATMKNSEILIVNPTNFEMYATLNVVLSSIEKEATMTVSVNNGEPSSVSIHPTFQNMQIKDFILKPGVNVVTFDAKEFFSVEYGLVGTAAGSGQETTMAFHVQSISIEIQP